MLWIYAFAIVLCFGYAASGQHTKQILLKTLNDSNRQVLTPEFSDYVDHVLKKHKVPGISLGVVRRDGMFESAAWGNKTEDGEHVTPDVRRPATQHPYNFLKLINEPFCRLYFTSDRLPKPSQPALLAF
jgi:hypothetical protein